MFNYLLRSLSGHSGVDYRHTEPLLPLNYTSASIRLTLLSHRGFGTFAGWYKSCRPCQGFSDSCAIMDINMSGMNSDQLHRSTLGIYSVGNRYCVCVGQRLKWTTNLRIISVKQTWCGFTQSVFKFKECFLLLGNNGDFSLRLSVLRCLEGEFVLINTDWIKDVLLILLKVGLKVSNFQVCVSVCVSQTELDGWLQPKPTETGFTG